MRAASRLVKAVRKVSLDFHLQLQFRLDNPKAPEKIYFGELFFRCLFFIVVLKSLK